MNEGCWQFTISEAWKNDGTDRGYDPAQLSCVPGLSALIVEEAGGTPWSPAGGALVRKRSLLPGLCLECLYKDYKVSVAHTGCIGTH